MNPLIKPKDVEVKDIDENVINVRLSRFPATEGRALITQYPTTSIKQFLKQDKAYEENEAMMLKLMSYVEVEVGGDYQRLDTRAKINNFIPDGETLLKIEQQMLGYNTAFFSIGRVSKSLDGLSASIKPLVTKILAQSLASSSAKEKQPSKS